MDARPGPPSAWWRSPLQFDEEPPDLVRGPEHGEHTDEVLQELGIEMDAIIDLKVAGAIL